MKSLLATGLLAAFLALLPSGIPTAHAAAAAAAAGAAAEAKPDRKPRQATPAQLAQRERMKSCAATARGRSLSGAPRKAFMKDCLSHR